MKMSALILALILLTPLTACSKEETKPVAEKKAAPIQSAEKVVATANIRSGQTIYAENCNSCHSSGVMGAPKTGDKQVWASLIAEGVDSLISNAINGVGKMPPKGGNMVLSDSDVKAAVEYMIEQSQ